MKTTLLALLFALSITVSCAGNAPTPGQVVNAVITCTAETCGGAAANPQCSTLEAAVMGCLTSGGDVSICLSGLPALVSVGYADVVCIVANLATTKTGTPIVRGSVQARAFEWLATQRVLVRAADPVRDIPPPLKH